MTGPGPSHPTPGFRGHLLAAALPALLTALLIALYGVDVPRVDHWAQPYAFEGFLNGKLISSKILISHNEHRVAVPRVVMFLLGMASGWNVKLEMFASLAIAAAGFWAILGIARRNRIAEASSAPFVMSTVAGSFAYFSWIQHENWLWGFQITFFLTQSLFLASLYTLHRDDWGSRRRVISAALLALLSTLSMAHGNFAWVALLPSLLAVQATRRERAVFVSGWILTGAVVAVAYFAKGVNFYREPGSQSPGLLESARYTIGILGCQFGKTIADEPVKSALWSGSAVLALLASGIVAALWSGAGWRRIAPWLSLALYAGAFCFAVSRGRGQWGDFVMTVPRYSTGPPLVIIAGLELWRVACERVDARRFSALLGVACLAVVACAVINSARVLDLVRNDSAMLGFSKTLLPVVNQFSENASTPVGNPFAKVVAPLPLASAILGMEKVDALGIRKLAPPLDFPPPGSAGTGVFQTLEAAPTAEPARDPLSPLRVNAGDSIRLKGHAVIGSARGKPDAILFVRDGETLLRTAAPPSFLTGDPSRATWDHVVTASAFGTGGCTITAYAYWSGYGKLERISSAPNRLEIADLKDAATPEPASP